MEVRSAILPGRLKRGRPPQPNRSLLARLKSNGSLG